ncbi:MAG: hypothetical protein GX446_04140 [Chthonomonadales bacterium]|nr:hypothetical protein [Chthonomonadales bacterium]
MDYVGLLDVSGIQAFIGGSHELTEIARRSRYIASLTATNGLYEQVAGLTGTEPIVLAGGNAALRARGSAGPLLEAFRKVSRRLIEDGTGLEVVGAIHEYERGTLARSYRDALVELERRKFTQPRGTAFALSGMEPPRPMSEAVADEPERLRLDDLYEPLQFERIIMRGEKVVGQGRAVRDRLDMMGVVSVDGLGMGRRLMTWLERIAAEGPSDDEFVSRFRAWSTGLQHRWDSAWTSVLGSLDKTFASADRSYGHPVKRSERVQLKEHPGGGFYLPCRRIYQGGDDMIFVADARVALSMTALLAAQLHEPVEETEEEFRSLRVSAGVVFVDSHYPFSRARELSESVRAAAKRATVRRSGGEPLQAESAVSWWINRQGALEARDEHITMKPYLLAATGDGSGFLAWSDFEDRILGGMWRSFATGRSKLKDILAAADQRTVHASHHARGTRGSAGAAAVQALLAARPLDSAQGQTLDWLQPTHDPSHGFDVQRETTPLLDAGELLDIHWPLRIAA